MLKTLISAALVIAISCGAFYHQTLGFSAYTAETKRRVEIERQPLPVPKVKFQNQLGESASWDSFHGQYVIVDFIYTRCETVCLGLGVEFSRLQRQAADLISDEQLQLLTISFDNEHDSPTQLSEYLSRFKADTDSWEAVRTENQTQLEQLKKAFGVIAIQDGLGGFIHNAALHLISPNGQLIKIVDYDDGPDLLRSISQTLSQTTGEHHAEGRPVALTTY